MNNYLPFPELLSEDVILGAKKYGSAGLADGMKALGIENDGCMESSILPVEENSVLVGTAVTVETKDGDNFPIHVAVYQGKPGYVLVIDGKGYEKCSYLGDLIGGAAKAIGYNGIVIDGLIRDRLGLKEMNLPIFSKGYMQRGPHKAEPGTINHTINCGGVEVKPGDLIVGDADGVTVVPKELIPVVFENAEKKFKYEENRRKVIDEYEKCSKESKPLPQLAPNWVVEMLSDAN